MHEQQTAWCQQEAQEYLEETEQRNTEVQILNQLKDYLASRSSETEEFIMMKQTTQ